MTSEDGTVQPTQLGFLVHRQSLPDFASMDRLELLRAVQDASLEWTDHRSSLTSKKGVFCCRRHTMPDIVLRMLNGEAKVRVDAGIVIEAGEGTAVSTRMRGLACCNCYVCMACAPAKIAKQKYVERTDNRVKRVVAAGGSVVLATLTHKHKDGESLEALWKMQHDALDLLNNGRKGVVTIIPEGTRLHGRVGCYENNHGRNGHHLHSHVVYCLDKAVEDFWRPSAKVSPAPPLSDNHRDLIRKFRRRADGPWSQWGKDGRQARFQLESAYQELKDEGFVNEWWDFIFAINEMWIRCLVEADDGSEIHEPGMLIGVDLKQVVDVAQVEAVTTYLFKGDVADETHGMACEVSLGGVTKQATAGNVSMMRLSYNALTDVSPSQRERLALAYREYEQVWSVKGRRKYAIGLSQLEKATDHLPELDVADEDEAASSTDEPDLWEHVGTIEPCIIEEGNCDDLRLNLIIDREVKIDRERVAKWLDFIQDGELRRLAYIYSLNANYRRGAAVRAEILILGLDSDKPPPDLPWYRAKLAGMAGGA
jgi:hypothetical protein